MKTVPRFLSLAALLVLGVGPEGGWVTAAEIPLQSREQIRATISRVVADFATDHSYSSLTLEYDSETTFRVYSNRALLAYGYYDEFAGADQQGEVFLYAL